MARHIEVSPYITASLRKTGRIYGFTEEERTWIREGDGTRFEGFCGFFVEQRNAGAPEDRRLHLRTFFALLRDQIKRHVDIAKALEALDYEDAPAEAGYWTAQAEAERKNTASLAHDWRASRGCR